MRTTDGGDPLDALPKPDECPPARGTRPRGYVSLSQLPQRKANDPFVTGEPASVELRFVNGKDQRFRIFVSGRTDASIRRYIDGAAGCLEWVPLREPLPTVLDPVLFDVPLVDAAVRVTGRSQNSTRLSEAPLPTSAGCCSRC